MGDAGYIFHGILLLLIAGVIISRRNAMPRQSPTTTNDMEKGVSHDDWIAFDDIDDDFDDSNYPMG